MREEAMFAVLMVSVLTTAVEVALSVCVTVKEALCIRRRLRLRRRVVKSFTVHSEGKE